LIFRETKFDRDVLALDKAGFLQALAKRGHEVWRGWAGPVTGATAEAVGFCI
jgi:hypothetical protein